MDIRDCFNKCKINIEKKGKTHKTDFMKIISKGLNDNIISIQDYEFIKNSVDKLCKLTSINKFVEIINKFANQDFKDLFAVLLNNISEVIDNNHFSCQKMIEKMTSYYKNIVLTQDQIDGSLLIFDMISNCNIHIMGLYGYAGTGKTTLITKLVNFLLGNKYIESVAFAAPTHKALNVIKFKFNDDFKFNNMVGKIKCKVEFITIHKLLGYKKDFKTDGSKKFTRGSKNLLCNYDIIIIDECSMIPMDMIKTMFGEIDVSTKNNRNPKIIFVGDPAQLPPVNEQFSILFSKNSEMDNIKNIASITLKQAVRSSNDDVNNLCSDIRNWVTGVTKIPNFRPYGANVKIYKYNNKIKKIQTKWFNDYLDCIKSSDNNSENSTIILTWTNDQCMEYNKIARNKLLNKKQLNKFEVGDILIFNDYYNMQVEKTDELNKQDSFHTSEQIKIMEIHDVIKCSKQFSEQLPKSALKFSNVNDIAKKYKDIIGFINKNTIRKYKGFKLKIQRLCENSANNNNTQNHIIYVLNDDSKDIFEKDITIIKNKIRELNEIYRGFYRNNIERIEEIIIKHLWCEMNENFIEQFASVREGFCVTTHKSQGSTFCNVFVDCNDIFKNKDTNIYMKCIYTAITRTSNKVFLLV